MITVNVASARGHDATTFESAQDALDFITSTAVNLEKWVFVNGELIADLTSLTLDRVSHATDITLSNQLVGG